MTDRESLPNRRAIERANVTFVDPNGAEMRAYVDFGFVPAELPLTIREVFVRPKGAVDSMISRLMDDAGLLISLLLQRGQDIEGLAESMGRMGGYPAMPGEATPLRTSRPPASLLGAIVDAGAQVQRELRAHRDIIEAPSPAAEAAP